MKATKITLIMLLVLVTLGTGSIYAQEDGSPYKIGILLWFGGEAFTTEMASMGYVEGENVTYITSNYDDLLMDPEATPEQYMEAYMDAVQQMIEAEVDVFVTNTDSDAVTLQPLVGDTPIVFAVSDDPVATGAVQDLIRPGGQMTGTVTTKPHERRLQILTEINPATDKVLYLYSPFTLDAESVLEQVRAVAETLNIELIVVPTPDSAAAIAALENMPEGVDWFFLTPYVPFDMPFTEAMMVASTMHRIGITWVTNDALPGYLVSYGPDVNVNFRLGAQIVDRILRGASPADLPVEATENYLTINLETAEAIGLEIPVGVLRQADRIVRPGELDYLFPAPTSTVE